MFLVDHVVSVLLAFTRSRNATGRLPRVEFYGLERARFEVVGHSVIPGFREHYNETHAASGVSLQEVLEFFSFWQSTLVSPTHDGSDRSGSIKCLTMEEYWRQSFTAEISEWD